MSKSFEKEKEQKRQCSCERYRNFLKMRNSCLIIEKNKKMLSSIS